MNLPKEAVVDFQKIYQQKFGVLLDYNESEIKAKQFLSLRLLISSKTKNDQT
ncbi:MAG: hypothetical protein WC069_00550 [Candidatus Shapirobacteria bacterium]